MEIYSRALGITVNNESFLILSTVGLYDSEKIDRTIMEDSGKIVKEEGSIGRLCRKGRLESLKSWVQRGTAR